MTRTEQQTFFAHEMKDIEISEANYSFLEEVYLREGYSVDVIKEIVKDLEVLGETDLDEFVKSFNNILINLLPSIQPL
ncbi:hypothetical protein QMU85_003444 [Photobacterium damselae]|uniref:hypothetical protein n=1 Tax=Photobacterium damselae TaxID=38293 RepID=UPI002542C7F0|nr:hypothetical protein [Photobacterium damselae]